MNNKTHTVKPAALKRVDPELTPQTFCQFLKVAAERRRQDATWGPDQNHSFEVWSLIIGEEKGEVDEAILDIVFDSSETDPRAHLDAYETELVHVAASAVAALEALDRVRAQMQLSKEEADGH